MLFASRLRVCNAVVSTCMENLVMQSELLAPGHDTRPGPISIRDFKVKLKYRQTACSSTRESQIAPGKDLCQLLALRRGQLQALAVAITGAQGRLVARQALVTLLTSFCPSFSGCPFVCGWRGLLPATHWLLVG